MHLIDVVAIVAGLLFRRDVRRYVRDRRRGATTSGPVSRSRETRIHLFSGDFPTEHDLISYCFAPVVEHGPEQFNIDLSGASIDTSYVEAAFGDEIHVLLDDFFAPKQRLSVSDKIGNDNSIVLVGEDAFGAMGYSLGDTARLRHLGFEDVAIPLPWSIGHAKSERYL